MLLKILTIAKTHLEIMIASLLSTRILKM